MRKKIIAMIIILVIVLPTILLLFLADIDGDGVLGLEEFQNNTSLFSSDTDNDGLTDGDELNSYYTDPRSSDTDKDGLKDGEEASLGSSPLYTDSDHDGWDDYYEVVTSQTSPNNKDTDGDWINDSDDPYPNDFSRPSTCEILSAEWDIFKNERSNIYYVFRITLELTLSRKPINSNDSYFLMNGSMVVDDKIFDEPSTWLDMENEHPVLGIMVGLGFLRNGTHTVSYQNFTHNFSTSLFSAPYGSSFISSVSSSEMNGILSDVIATVKPHKYFGLALVFSGHTSDTLGLRVIAFRGCSIESNEIRDTKRELESQINKVLTDVLNGLDYGPMSYSEIK